MFGLHYTEYCDNVFKSEQVFTFHLHFKSVEYIHAHKRDAHLVYQSVWIRDEQTFFYNGPAINLKIMCGPHVQKR